MGKKKKAAQESEVKLSERMFAATCEIKDVLNDFDFPPAAEYGVLETVKMLRFAEVNYKIKKDFIDTIEDLIGGAA